METHRPALYTLTPSDINTVLSPAASPALLAHPQLPPHSPSHSEAALSLPVAPTLDEAGRNPQLEQRGNLKVTFPLPRTQRQPRQEPAIRAPGGLTQPRLLLCLAHVHVKETPTCTAGRTKESARVAMTESPPDLPNPHTQDPCLPDPQMPCPLLKKSSCFASHQPWDILEGQRMGRAGGMGGRCKGRCEKEGQERQGPA